MYQNIMVPLDGSQLAECVLPHVEAFIQGCRVKNVTLVRVVEPASMRLFGPPTSSSKVDYSQVLEYTRRIEEERKSAAAEYLQAVIEGLRRKGVKFQQEVLMGNAADSLVEFAEAGNIDLIVIATHGRSGVSRWVRGSVAERILRASRVPVLMVRAPGELSESKAA